LDGAAAYAPLDFLADVRKGVFSEVYSGSAQPIDAYRRNLQRAYIETLSNRVNGAQAQSDDVRACFRGEFKTLDADLQGPRISTDRATALHVQDLRQQIARALDPTVQAAAPRATSDFADLDIFDVTASADVCWP